MAVPALLETIVVPLGAADVSKVVPCTAVRSTLLSASLLSLRERGLTERYYALLPKDLHLAMQTLVAGSWVPMDVASTVHGSTPEPRAMRAKRPSTLAWMRRPTCAPMSNCSDADSSSPSTAP